MQREGPVLRNLAVLISALVTMSAQAQDASTPVVEKKPTSVAPPAEGEQSAIDVATLRPPMESGRPLPPLSAPPAKPDAGVDASARQEPDDCGMEQSLFDQDDVPVGIRFYPLPAPTARPKPDRQQQRAWDVRPAVATAGRCLRRYVIQVRSESGEPWAVKTRRWWAPTGRLST